MTGKMSPNIIDSPNIRLRIELITWVKGLRLIAALSPPDKLSTGNNAELKKKTGSTIAFIMVS